MSGQVDPSFIVGMKQDAVSVSKEGEFNAIMSGVVLALCGQPLQFDSGRVLSAAPIKIEGETLLRLDGSEVDGITLATALAYADSVGIPKMVDESVLIPEGLLSVKVEWTDPTEADIAIKVKQEKEKLKKMGLLDDFLRMTTNGTASQAPAATVPAQQIKTVDEMPQPPQSSNKASPTMKYSALVEKFIKHKTRWRKGTRDAARSIFDVFMGLNGDIDVSEINHPMMTDFFETLEDKVPANVKVILPDLSIERGC